MAGEIAAGVGAAAAAAAAMAALLKSKGFNRAYGDLAEPLAKQLGEFLGDCGKAIRWLMPSIQFMAHNQDMLLKERIRQVDAEVPEERQIPASPSILFPVLESLSRQEEGNPLAELYMNLLKRAIDRDRVNEAHPAFCNIINQLSGDEAILLCMFWSKAKDVNVPDPGYTYHRFGVEELAFPQHVAMYITHLRSLHLLSQHEHYAGEASLTVEWKSPVPPPERAIESMLTPFGRLFCQACIPNDLSGLLRKPAQAEGGQ